MKTISTWVQRQTKAFAASESGAVTVDWVVLTAALCAMVLTIFTILTQGVFESAASAINSGIIEAADKY
jgi:hypothetical protein